MILGTAKKEDESYANANCTHRCMHDSYTPLAGMVTMLLMI